MSRTVRILVVKTVLALISTPTGSTVVPDATPTVVASAVNRPLLAQAEARNLQGANDGRIVLGRGYVQDADLSVPKAPRGKGAPGW
jgi:hypothetical protein